MTARLTGLHAEEFLRDSWQKKPLLIRQAFSDFKPELDADDIAGLAGDELAESRLISGSFPEHDWALRYGPFSEQDFAGLPENNWTLLVQDVEKHYPPLQSLLDAFSFLPSWRIDDLMVSVAAPGGSVGPHVDQYDVFLLQAEGRRLWQLADSFDPALRQGCELNVLESFTPEQEWTLEPGDMLYLPPGIAHHGVALDQCMTWSVGMRAPSSADLLQALGEWLAQYREEGPRYNDARLSPSERAGEIDADAIECFAQMVKGIADNKPDFQTFLGSFLSSYRRALNPAPPEQTTDLPALKKALENGASIQHNPWTRLNWLEAGQDAMLFAAGESFLCTIETATQICSQPVNINHDADDPTRQLDLVCSLINQGHLYLQYPED
jgi:50S ribosomal protein L16 3-hydroxylase